MLPANKAAALFDRATARAMVSSMEWTDKAAVAGSKVIATGVLKKLEELNLSNNQIGDAGVMALAEAAGKGTLPQLEGLGLSDNSTISQQAKDALKAALPDCKVYL